MTATYSMNVNGEKRLMMVEGVSGKVVAEEISQHLATQYENVTLIHLEDYTARYTVAEVMEERNLLRGSSRRYSTGRGTVTIPEE